jgi:hypothetical protein
MAEIQQQQLNINTLPIEMLRRIMSFLSQCQLGSTVAQVCQLWRQLAYDPVRWLTLDLELADVSLDKATLQSCFDRAPLLRCLDLDARFNKISLDANDLKYCSSHCPQVVDIRIRWFKTLDFAMINVLVECFPNLTSLDVTGCVLIDDDCVCRICDLHKLKDLNISHCTRLADEAVCVVASRLEFLENLNLTELSRVTDK